MNAKTITGAFAGVGAALLLAGCGERPPTFEVKGENAYVTSTTVTLQQVQWQERGANHVGWRQTFDMQDVFDFAAQTRCLVKDSRSSRASDVVLHCQPFDALDEAGRRQLANAQAQFAKGPGHYVIELSRTPLPR